MVPPRTGRWFARSMGKPQNFRPFWRGWRNLQNFQRHLNLMWLKIRPVKQLRKFVEAGLFLERECDHRAAVAASPVQVGFILQTGKLKLMDTHSQKLAISLCQRA